MIFSLSWLGELVDLKGISDQRLISQINSKSFEVESLSKSRFLGVSDKLLDVEVAKTNRVDVFGYFGFAAELAAVFNRPLKKILPPRVTLARPVSKAIKIDKQVCRAFTLTGFESVSVRPSPKWLKTRLLASNIKPINNVVDITNYVMLLTGQPMHAYDAEKLTGNFIEARRVKRGETLKTLDGQTHMLGADDIAIADGSGVIGLGGVMGGESTMVTNKTRTVLLEAASFNPSSVRRSSWSHNLRTDSASRFEKGLPAEFTEVGAMQTIEFMQELAGAEAVGFSKKNISRSGKTKIEMEQNYPGALLGFEVKNREIEKVFKSLSFTFKKSKNNYTVEVPFWRTDLEQPQDLVEEIGRLLGLERIPSQLPLVKTNTFTDPEISFRQNLRPIIQGLGFDEVYNYSFSDPKATNNLGFRKNRHITLENPLSMDQEILRISLMPNLLKTARENLRFQARVSVFEFGNVYSKRETTNFHDLPKLGFATSANSGSPEKIFKNLKGRTEALFDILHLKVAFRPSVSEDNLQGVVDLQAGGQSLGRIGLLLSGKRPIVLAEIDVEGLMKATGKTRRFEQFSVFPKQYLDLAVEVSKKVSWGEIKDLIIKENLVSEVGFLSSYEGQQIKKGNKSVAMRIGFQAADRTLKDKETKESFEKILKSLRQKLNAKIRE